MNKMPYNLTALQANDTSYYVLVDVVNEASGGILVMGLVVGLFIIQFVWLNAKTQSLAGSLALSAWACFIYSIFLSMAELLNFYFIIGFLTVAGFGTLVTYLTQRG